MLQQVITNMVEKNERLEKCQPKRKKKKRYKEKPNEDFGIKVMGKN